MCAVEAKWWLMTLSRAALVFVGAVCLMALPGCFGHSGPRVSEGERRMSDADTLLSDAERDTRELKIERATSKLEEAHQLLSRAELQSLPEHSMLLERWEQAQAAL